MAEKSANQSKSVRNAAIVAEYEPLQPTYSLFAGRVEDLVSQLAATLGIAAEVSSRAKEVDSLREKLDNKSYTSLSDVPDLSGVRLIAHYLADVDEICRVLGEEFDIADDDAHAFRKVEEFGYASRHLVVTVSAKRRDLPEWTSFVGLRCEIQVRTILQHAWASISHSLDYKYGAAVPQDVRRTLFQVAALIEVGDGLFQDFQSALATVRQQYETTASGGDWRDLPVDAESLISAWAKWRPTQLQELVPEEDRIKIQSASSGFVASIALLASSLQIRTVGELADFLKARENVELFKGEFVPDGRYSADYLALLLLFGAARSRDIRIPGSIDSERHSRSLKAR